MIKYQSTDSIMMVEPVGFHANPQTIDTNAHQQQDNTPLQEIQNKALFEHQNLVKKIRENDIDVMLVKGTSETPDDLFCNNWVSFHQDQSFVLYPLLAPNRRLERRADLIQQFTEKYGEPIDLSSFEEQDQFLESTGSMVLDRVNQVAYAAISSRTDHNLFIHWCEKMNFKPMAFHWSYPNQQPVYHTNVIMFIGTEVAAICSEGLEKSEKNQVMSALQESHEVVELSFEQINHFCGNALELRNKQNKKILACSQSAFDKLSSQQKKTYESYYDNFIVSDISTIEKYGGGSVRCLILERF